MLLPLARREFVNAQCRMLTDTLQDIDEIVVRVDVVQAAGHQQTLDDPDLFGAELGPRKQPILAAHRYGAQRPLQVVGVDSYIRIGKIDLKRLAPLLA